MVFAPELPELHALPEPAVEAGDNPQKARKNQTKLERLKEAIRAKKAAKASGMGARALCLSIQSKSI